MDGEGIWLPKAAWSAMKRGHTVLVLHMRIEAAREHCLEHRGIIVVTSPVFPEFFSAASVTCRFCKPKTQVDSNRPAAANGNIRRYEYIVFPLHVTNQARTAPLISRACGWAAQPLRCGF